ncbi:MAG: tRNA glutamyl-Q(34) synthetase GluQRS [Actinomycetota bacterium]
MRRTLYLERSKSYVAAVWNGWTVPDGRFAPSPSAPLHVGNLRTALAAWLFARHDRARFTLRIEDLDRERCSSRYEATQIDDLARLGLDWDGEVVRQSQRTELYRDALDRLVAAGRVYPCWCTRAEVRAASSAPHGPLPEGAYAGTCRELTTSQRADLQRSGRPNALRLDARGEAITFEDRYCGEVSAVVDDFVLWRADQTPAYNLAVVVDDSDQEIGEVVRGADLLDTTARQLLVGRLLGYETPRYAHIPLVLGADGNRLAKRHGSVTLSDLALLGRSESDVLSWIATSLGLAERGEIVTPKGLVARFEPDQMPLEPSVFS